MLGKQMIFFNKDCFFKGNLSICSGRNGSTELHEALEKILWWFIEKANILNICNLNLVIIMLFWHLLLFSKLVRAFSLYSYLYSLSCSSIYIVWCIVCMVYAYVHIVNYDYEKKNKKRHYGGKILSHDRFDIFCDISLLYIMLGQCLEYAEL